MWSQPLIIWLMRKLDSNELVAKISGVWAPPLPASSRLSAVQTWDNFCSVNQIHKPIGELHEVVLQRQQNISLPCLWEATLHPSLRVASSCASIYLHPWSVPIQSKFLLPLKGYYKFARLNKRAEHSLNVIADNMLWFVYYALVDAEPPPITRLGWNLI